MVQRMAPRKKVSVTKIRLALKHAVRNGVDLSAITTGPQEIVLEELLLALARENSTASVVEKFKAVDAATRVPLLGKRQPVVPDVVVVEVRLSARAPAATPLTRLFLRSSAPLPFQPDLSQELKATLAKLTKLQALYKSSLKLSQSQVNLNLALSKALDASKAEIELFKLDVHMLDDLVAAEQAKTNAAQDEVASLKEQLAAEIVRRDYAEHSCLSFLPILAGVYSDKGFMCDFDGKYTGMLDLKWAANLYDITAKIELARGMKTRYGSHCDNARNADKCRARALPDTAICTCCGDHVSTHFDEHCVTKEEMHVFDRHKHVECRTYCGLLSCTQAWRLFAPEK